MGEGVEKGRNLYAWNKGYWAAWGLTGPDFEHLPSNETPPPKETPTDWSPWLVSPAFPSSHP